MGLKGRPSSHLYFLVTNPILRLPGDATCVTLSINSGMTKRGSL